MGVNIWRGGNGDTDDHDHWHRYHHYRDVHAHDEVKAAAEVAAVDNGDT